MITYNSKHVTYGFDPTIVDGEVLAEVVDAIVDLYITPADEERQFEHLSHAYTVKRVMSGPDLGRRFRVTRARTVLG